MEGAYEKIAVSSPVTARKLRFVKVVSAVVFGTLMFYMYCRSKTSGNTSSEKSGALAAICRDGDIVLRRGNGMWSRLFANISIHDKRFSHVGIILVRDGKVTVTHASADDLTGVGAVHE